MSYPENNTAHMDTTPLDQNSAELGSSATPNSSGPLLTWGLRNEEFIYILDPLVNTGLACGCTCPACGERLVAKHGTGKRMAPESVKSTG